MAIYTTFVKPEDRPNLRNHLEVWAVVDDTNGHIIAYCLHAKDAEYLKALIAYYGDLASLKRATESDEAGA